MISKEQLCLMEGHPDPCGIVIFGASGDLTQRKLLPSLFYLFTHHMMPKSFYVIGVARTAMSNEEFRKKVQESLNTVKDSQLVKDFIDKFFYLSGDYGSPSTYASIKSMLATQDKAFSVNGSRIFYLSTPPSLYSSIIDHLGQAELTKSSDRREGWVRVVIEKPFGHSFDSAFELNQNIRRILNEKQIYRIDHYLGKETVQNILMFRFANIIFEPVWNRNYIDHVRITATEQLGVEHRAGYYEQAGVIRDMMQNHLLQLVALIGMEPPSSLDADVVRDRRAEVMGAFRIFRQSEVKDMSVIGQYGPGQLGNESVVGYRNEPGVSPKSRIPTYAAMRVDIENWRWFGVPFYLRSGKRMPERRVEIVVQFKKVPTSIFKPLTADMLTPNQLTFRIQPDEGITMQFEAKKPGPKLCMATVSMDFGFEQAFKTPQPESYARLFHDAMLGDQTLFARSDEIKASWKYIDPILNYWESFQSPEPLLYPAGTWGPESAEDFLKKSHHSWINS